MTPTINGRTVTFAIDNAADVLDCTYTNRARGTIIVEKITDDGIGAFDFTSSTLTPVAVHPHDDRRRATAGKDSRDVREPRARHVRRGRDGAGGLEPRLGIVLGRQRPSCDRPPGRRDGHLHVPRRARAGAIRITKLRKHAADGR